MDIEITLGQLDLRSDIVALSIILLACLIILYVNRARIQLRFREWRIERSLNRIGVEQIRNFVCPDGLDGHYSFDRLALTPEAIVMVVYKPYIGNIYCAERISEWTQVIGQKSFKFENPLFELENQLTALRQITDKVELRGLLVFSHSAIFPKGHPDSVVQPDTIPQRYLDAPSDEVNAHVMQAWER